MARRSASPSRISAAGMAAGTNAEIAAKIRTRLVRSSIGSVIILQPTAKTGKNKKGGSEEPPLVRAIAAPSSPYRRDGAKLPGFSPKGLRQVIAERGPKHVVDGLGLKAAGTGPSVFAEVRVLNAPAEAAFWPLVDLVPEAQSSFIDEAGIPGASSPAGGCASSSRHAFGAATGVVSSDVAVAADLVVGGGVRGDVGRYGSKTIC